MGEESAFAELVERHRRELRVHCYRLLGSLREHLPERRLEWARPLGPTEEERAVVQRYVTAVERADLDAVAELLAADIRAIMPPWPMWFSGRDAVLATLTVSWDPEGPYYVGHFRMVPTAANGMPAVGSYVRAPGEDTYRAFAIGVLRVENGLITELSAFHDPGLFPAFELPMTFPPADVSTGVPHT